MKVVRVLAVADASVLAGFRRALSPESIEVVATASTPARALAQLRRADPDVVVLDLGLTQTDVFQLLAQLVLERPAPVLALLSGDEPARSAERARAAGASDVAERPGSELSAHDETKSPHPLSLRVLALAATQWQRASNVSLRSAPRTSEPGPLAQSEGQLTAATSTKSASPLKAAMSSKSVESATSQVFPKTSGASLSKPAVRSAALTPIVVPRVQLIAIGASTGGTLALTELLRDLPVSSPPIVVVQHMLPEFTADFAERLDDACALYVSEAADGELLRSGAVLLAPGGRHLRVTLDAGLNLCASVSDDAPVGKHRPSVDVLFHSCAEHIGAATIGVVLTGMGDDGARGLLELRNRGARTIVQDQASSACFGMPAAAIALGAAQHTLSVHEIAETLIALQQR